MPKKYLALVVLGLTLCLIWIIKVFVMDLTLVKLIMFSNSYLLTPIPVNLNNEWLEIKVSEPLTAITGGACLTLDISDAFVSIFGYEYQGSAYTRDQMNKKIKKRSIMATLTTESGEEHNLFYDGTKLSRVSKKEVSLIIFGEIPTPINVKYTKLKIKSTIPLNMVNLSWQNSRW